MSTLAIERVPFAADKVICALLKWHYKSARAARNEDDFLARQRKALIVEARRRGLRSYSLDLLDPPPCVVCKKSPGTHVVGRNGFFCSRPLCQAAARRMRKKAAGVYLRRSEEGNRVFSRDRARSDSAAIKSEEFRKCKAGHR